MFATGTSGTSHELFAVSPGEPPKLRYCMRLRMDPMPMGRLVRERQAMVGHVMPSPPPSRV